MLHPSLFFGVCNSTWIQTAVFALSDWSSYSVLCGARFGAYLRPKSQSDFCLKNFLIQNFEEKNCMIYPHKKKKNMIMILYILFLQLKELIYRYIFVVTGIHYFNTFNTLIVLFLIFPTLRPQPQSQSTEKNPLSYPNLPHHPTPKKWNYYITACTKNYLGWTFSSLN